MNFLSMINDMVRKEKIKQTNYLFKYSSEHKKKLNSWFVSISSSWVTGLYGELINGKNRAN